VKTVCRGHSRENWRSFNTITHDCLYVPHLVSTLITLVPPQASHLKFIHKVRGNNRQTGGSLTQVIVLGQV